MPLFLAARVVTATAVHSPGWIDVDDAGAVIAVGEGDPPRAVDVDLGAATVVPGFVDMHVHGGGGGAYTDLDEASVRRARAAHLAHGTTTSMASLVAAEPARLRAQVDLLGRLVGEGVIDGIHLEGPWISRDRRGAHDAQALRTADPAELTDLLSRADGTIRMITFAPELPGAIDAIRQTVAAGSVAAIGHTDATYEQVEPAIDAGATVATHLFNAMRPIHHRDPGPVVALLGDPRVTIEMIADGTHLHPELYRHALDAAGAHRVALVTDAMAAAALGDGHYTLGELRVDVRDRVARIAGTETIAGSTTTMDALFRAAVHAGGGLGTATADAALIAAVRQTATTPAAAIGWNRVGDLAPGRRADFVVLDDALHVTRVHAAGAPATRL